MYDIILITIVYIVITICVREKFIHDLNETRETGSLCVPTITKLSLPPYKTRCIANSMNHRLRRKALITRVHRTGELETKIRRYGTLQLPSACITV